MGLDTIQRIDRQDGIEADISTAIEMQSKFEELYSKDAFGNSLFKFLGSAIGAKAGGADYSSVLSDFRGFANLALDGVLAGSGAAVSVAATQALVGSGVKELVEASRRLDQVDDLVFQQGVSHVALADLYDRYFIGAALVNAANELIREDELFDRGLWGDVKSLTWSFTKGFASGATSIFGDGDARVLKEGLFAVSTIESVLKIAEKSGTVAADYRNAIHSLESATLFEADAIDSLKADFEAILAARQLTVSQQEVPESGTEPSDPEPPVTVQAASLDLAPGQEVPLASLFSWSVLDPAFDPVAFFVRDRTDGNGFLKKDGIRLDDGVIFKGLVEEIDRWSYQAGPDFTTDQIGFNIEGADGYITPSVVATVSTEFQGEGGAPNPLLSVSIASRLLELDDTIPLSDLFPSNRWIDADPSHPLIAFAVQDRTEGGGYLLRDGVQMDERRIYIEPLTNLNLWSFQSSSSFAVDEIGFNIIQANGDYSPSFPGGAGAIVVSAEYIAPSEVTVPSATTEPSITVGGKAGQRGKTFITTEPGNEIIGTRFNDTVIANFGNDLIDLSAGGDNEISISVRRGNNYSNTVMGGDGSDTLTLLAGEGTSISRFQARLRNEEGQVLRTLDNSSSFEDIEAFARQTGPHEVLFGWTSATPGLSTTTISNIETVNYIGGSNSDLMVGFGGDEVFRGGLGNDVAYGNGGRNTYIGTAEELNGDTILDFSSYDVIVVEEIEFGLGQLAFDPENSELRIDSNGDGDHDVRITLRGTFDQDEFSVVHSDGVTEVRYGSPPTEEPEPEEPGTEEPVEDEPTGDDTVVLSGTITNRANEALSDLAVTFSMNTGGSFETQTNEEGGFSFTLEADAAGRIDAMRDYSSGDPAISASDALDVLRLAVGLDASWGPATAHDFIAADINRDGSVTAADALDVLRAAVGLESEHAPRWVFIDDDADLGHIDSGNVSYDTGIDLSAINADVQHSMSAILLGSTGEYA